MKYNKVINIQKREGKKKLERIRITQKKRVIKSLAIN